MNIGRVLNLLLILAGVSAVLMLLNTSYVSIINAIMCMGFFVSAVILYGVTIIAAAIKADHNSAQTGSDNDEEA